MQSFRFIASKSRKNVTSYFNQINLPLANVYFFVFGVEDEKITSIYRKKKSQKAAISETKIKIIARNPTHDLSKQVIEILARNLKLWF